MRPHEAARSREGNGIAGAIKRLRASALQRSPRLPSISPPLILGADLFWAFIPIARYPVTGGRTGSNPQPGVSWGPVPGGLLKARLLEGRGRRGNPWKRFRPGRWYSAEWAGPGSATVRLMDRGVSAEWAADDVEIRTAADDEWEVRAVSRLSMSRDGQTIEYPARLAECPEGHVRQIPTRFDAGDVVLRCAECERGYRLSAAAGG